MVTIETKIIRDNLIALEKEYKELEECLSNVNIDKETTIRAQITNLNQRSILNEVLKQILEEYQEKGLL